MLMDLPFSCNILIVKFEMIHLRRNVLVSNILVKSKLTQNFTKRDTGYVNYERQVMFDKIVQLAVFEKGHRTAIIL